jgi:alpha-tubulin suppressor-like RCC1 family protein
MFAITETGAVYAWGRNEKGQLGLGDTKDRKCPTLVNALSGYRIVKAATGRNHSLFLTGKYELKSLTSNLSRLFTLP